MNQLHGRYDISNEDFLYVMSTFVLEPIRWMDRFGWRKMVENERLAQFNFWREIARRMNIKNVPESYEEFERFNVEYERQHMHYTEASSRVGQATVDLFLGWFLPKPLRPLGAPFMYAMLDDRLLEAFRFPKQPKWLRWLVAQGLVLRGRVLRFLPPRTKPRLRTEMKHRSYPNGYTIEQLGPPKTSGEQDHERLQTDETTA
jgi:hypothetical protein